MKHWIPVSGLIILLSLGCFVGSDAEFSMNCDPAPYIEGSPAPEATARNPYTATFHGAYNCGMYSCFSLEPVSLPEGALIDNYGVKTVRWTPPDSLAGTTQTLTVRTPRDPCGDSAYFTWKVTVLPAPAIQRFEAAATALHPGESTSLTAVFTDGTGHIDLWTTGTLGVVLSGVPIATPPLMVTTTFELTVLNRLGHGTSRTLTVLVQ